MGKKVHCNKVEYHLLRCILIISKSLTTLKGIYSVSRKHLPSLSLINYCLPRVGNSLQWWLRCLCSG